ncbi:hypothetical protein NL676_009379 [Syzygium grande]|nr:hypothetical protein NL676_009379 [Syzygium grande]
MGNVYPAGRHPDWDEPSSPKITRETLHRARRGGNKQCRGGAGIGIIITNETSVVAVAVDKATTTMVTYVGREPDVSALSPAFFCGGRTSQMTTIVMASTATNETIVLVVFVNRLHFYELRIRSIIPLPVPFPIRPPGPDVDGSYWKIPSGEENLACIFVANSVYLHVCTRKTEKEQTAEL